MGSAKLAHMSTNAERFGLIVRKRRDDLAMSQLDVWQAGGPSNTTLTTIENGLATSLQNATAKKLDRGLRWRPGSARRVWGGGEPSPLEDAPTASGYIAEVEASSLSPETKAWILDRIANDPKPPPTEPRKGVEGA